MRGSLTSLDFAVVLLYLFFVLVVGSLFARRAGRSLESFFVGGRKFPWWLAGTSMVATTFAADTPLAVAGIVASDGIAGNWIWWCWAISHVFATFFFARLWRRSGVITDAEIVELRYGGKPAAALRAFKAAYFGLFINCLTMAWVIAAMVKISRAFFDVEPGIVIAVCMLTAVAYTTLGGFRSVVVTDLAQFALGMGGAILLAVLVVRGFGGVGAVPVENRPGEGLLGELAAVVEERGEGSLDEVLDFVPTSDHPTIPWIFFATLLIAGWWRYAEGQGYLVQRFAACRDEAHAEAASLWFAVAHNALRPWPWIVVGLASLVIYPRLPGSAEALPPVELEGRPAAVTVTPPELDLVSGGELVIDGLGSGCSATVGGQSAAITDGVASFAGFSASGRFVLEVDCGLGPRPTRPPVEIRVELLDREMAYPLIMGRSLPRGLLGLVIASLLAAFMSTIDTHTNWGASYLVQDLYKRFVRPEAPPHHYVTVSRLAIVLMAALAGVSALYIQNIAAVWRFLLGLGAGLGSVTAARWYWPRVTVWAEFGALGVSTFLAIGLELFATETFFGGDNPFFFATVPAWAKVAIIAGSSLAVWIPLSLWGPPNDDTSLTNFARRVRPPGPGWVRYRGESESERDELLPIVWRFGAGLVIVFGALFGTGDLVLGSVLRGVVLLAVAAGFLWWISRRRVSLRPR